MWTLSLPSGWLGTKCWSRRISAVDPPTQNCGRYFCVTFPGGLYLHPVASWPTETQRKKSSPRPVYLWRRQTSQIYSRYFWRNLITSTRSFPTGISADTLPHPNKISHRQEIRGSPKGSAPLCPWRKFRILNADGPRFWNFRSTHKAQKMHLNSYYFEFHFQRNRMCINVGCASCVTLPSTLLLRCMCDPEGRFIFSSNQKVNFSKTWTFLSIASHFPLSINVLGKE